MRINGEFSLISKTVSRGNEVSRERHTNSNHKNDRSYNYKKAIAPINHQAGVVAKRKKDNDHTHDYTSTLNHDTMEVNNQINSFDNPLTEGQKGDASQSTVILTENETSNSSDKQGIKLKTNVLLFQKFCLP